MDDPSGSTIALIIFGSFFMSAICSFARGANSSFSPAKLEGRLKTDKAKARLAKFIEKNTELFMATSIADLISNILFFLGILFCFTKDGVVDLEKVFFPFLFGLLILLVFAKAIPLAFACRYSELVMQRAMHFMTFCYWLLIWIIWPLANFIRLFDRMSIENRKLSSALLEKEILHVVKEGEKEGILHNSEKSMIEGIIDLREVEVEEIMTPRANVVFVNVEDSLSKALASSKGYSRFPVCRESRDDIVGVLYIKDLLEYWEDENRENLSLQEIMRKPYFIPESKPIDKLLKEFQEQKLHIAVVLDEYGGTAGLVTIEDIIEEIIGEIVDEHDSQRLEDIIVIDENTAEVDAKVHVDELNEKLNIDIPIDEDYDTIGGFLFASLGHIPAVGDSHIHKNLKFTILKASNQCINRIRMEKKSREDKNL